MPCVEMDYGQCRRVLSFWSVMESHIYSSISRDESDWRFFRAQIALSYQEKRARPVKRKIARIYLLGAIFGGCYGPTNHTITRHQYTHSLTRLLVVNAFFSLQCDASPAVYLLHGLVIPHAGETKLHQTCSSHTNLLSICHFKRTITNGNQYGKLMRISFVTCINVATVDFGVCVCVCV